MAYVGLIISFPDKISRIVTELDRLLIMSGMRVTDFLVLIIVYLFRVYDLVFSAERTHSFHFSYLTTHLDLHLCITKEVCPTWIGNRIPVRRSLFVPIS